MTSPGWLVYLLRCGDGTLYAGITNDLPARLLSHAATGKGARGAKYTRGRGPFAILWTQEAASRSEALRVERALKRMRRLAKLALAESRGRIRLK
jgi:putative endonuclease